MRVVLGTEYGAFFFVQKAPHPRPHAAVHHRTHLSRTAHVSGRITRPAHTKTPHIFTMQGARFFIETKTNYSANNASRKMRTAA